MGWWGDREKARLLHPGDVRLPLGQEVLALPSSGLWPFRAHCYLFNLQPKKEAFHLGRPLKNSWCRRSESLRLAQDRLPDTGWEPRGILRWRSYESSFESSLQEHPMITFYRIGKGCLSCIWTYAPLVCPLVVPGGLNLVWQSLFSVHFLWTYKNIERNPTSYWLATGEVQGYHTIASRIPWHLFIFYICS
jgi:hypothetical protein